MAVSPVESDVASLELAEAGRERVEWAGRAMPVLRSLRQRLRAQRPFQRVGVAACLHVTPETAVLVRTLQEGGARVRLAASNPLSTQDDVAAALVAEYGVEVFARRGCGHTTYRAHLDAALAVPPRLLLDDACDLVTAVHADPARHAGSVLGGCEETTTGVLRLRSMAAAGALTFPMVAVPDAATKRLFDHRYGMPQSTVDAILRSTNMLLAGATVVVAGFGCCGQGVAQRLRGLGARVLITEVHPVRALDAALEGFTVLPMAEAAGLGDVFITATGNRGVVRGEHMAAMKDGALLVNAGHFDVEVDVAWLAASAVRRSRVRPLVDEFQLPNGRRLLLLAQGRVANLAAAEGHPAQVMDVSFAVQVLALEWLLTASLPEPRGAVVPVPEEIDREVSRLVLPTMGVGLDQLTKEQQGYLTSWSPEPRRRSEVLS